MLGRAGGERLRLGELVDIGVETLVETYDGALPAALGDA